MSTGVSVTKSSPSSTASKPSSSAFSSMSGPKKSPSDPVSAADVRADLLLPSLHDIVRTVEKDSQDVSQKNRDSLEAAQKVLEIQRRVEGLREDIYRLPGIERSHGEQRAHLRTLKKQLELKKDLIAKYKALNYKASGLASDARDAEADNQSRSNS